MVRKRHRSCASDHDEDCSKPPCRTLMRCEKHEAGKEALRKTSLLLQKALDDSSYLQAIESIRGGAQHPLHEELFNMCNIEQCRAARFARRAVRRREKSPRYGSALMTEIVDKLQRRIGCNYYLLQQGLRDKKVLLSIGT